MYTEKAIQFNQLQGRPTLYVNAWNVEIKRDGEVVFSRQGDDDLWMDDKHMMIVRALEALEKAVEQLT